MMKLPLSRIVSSKLKYGTVKNLTYIVRAQIILLNAKHLRHASQYFGAHKVLPTSLRRVYRA